MHSRRSNRGRKGDSSRKRLPSRFPALKPSLFSAAAQNQHSSQKVNSRPLRTRSMARKVLSKLRRPRMKSTEKQARRADGLG